MRSVPESPASSQRPFDFADLGRPMPKSVRTPPAPPRADATGQLEELSADDILESDDIDSLEAAAAGFTSFEVGEVDGFDEVQVEGAASPLPAPAPIAAPIGAAAVLAPVVNAPVVTAPVMNAPVVTAPMAAAPLPTTLMGMPAAPATSPLPLDTQSEDDGDDAEQGEEKKPVTARTPATMQSAIAQPAAAPVVEKTLEIRGNDMAKVAAAAAKLGSEPEQTEVLVRSAMPASLQNVRAAQPASGPMPAAGRPHGRPSSVAPVALDVSRPPMPVIPPMARVPSVHVPSRGRADAPRGLSGLAIGGIAAAALVLVSLVGIGGYAASRTLSAKTDAVEGTSETSAASESTTTAAGVTAPAVAAPAVAADPPGAASSPIDVSSLPSAPVPGSAPRGFTGKGSFSVTPPPVVVPAAPPVAVAAAPAAPAAAPAAPAARSNGGALAAPGGRGAPAGAPLPPPPSAPAVAAAPAAPAPASTTGVVHVDPNLRAVQVDGNFRHANDGSVVVSCGQHRIKAGMRDAQVVNVPCGGAVSL